MTPKKAAGRFRIDIDHTAGQWGARIYDMADHGPDVPYAAVSSDSLERTLNQAAHYVLMAGPSSETQTAVSALSNLARLIDGVMP